MYDHSINESWKLSRLFKVDTQQPINGGRTRPGMTLKYSYLVAQAAFGGSPSVVSPAKRAGEAPCL
jgi:hypothetical protein